MPDKEFIDPRQLLRDSFGLAAAVFNSGFMPELFLVVWRGGAPIGLAVHEYFLYRGHDRPQVIVRARSYSGIDSRREPVIDNLADVLGGIPQDSAVLVVDDIFDSGNTLCAIREVLKPRTENVRTATVYFRPGRGQADARPDYHVRLSDKWLVFPHELEGLTQGEIMAKDEFVHGLVFG